MLEALHPFLPGGPLHLVIAQLAALFSGGIVYPTGDAGWLYICSCDSLVGVGGLLCVIEVKGVFILYHNEVYEAWIKA